jgi:DNA-binding SARP family transcriptional activator
LKVGQVLDFRILGPLEVLEDGERVELGDELQKTFLAVLLVKPGRVVPLERLAEATGASFAALRRHASDLQETLGAEILEARPSGYRVQLKPGQLDVDRFRVLVGAARGLTPDAQEKLRHALALWRGPALADFTDRPFAQDAIAELEQLHRRAEARLRAG